MDEVDRKIISKLQLNGRTTFKELGELSEAAFLSKTRILLSPISP